MYKVEIKAKLNNLGTSTSSHLKQRVSRSHMYNFDLMSWKVRKTDRKI